MQEVNSEELHDFFSSPNIIRQIKSRRMNWKGMCHACERRKECTRFWWESPKEEDHTEDRSVDGRMGSYGDWLRRGV
jgi:hypothetical protein